MGVMVVIQCIFFVVLGFT